MIDQNQQKSFHIETEHLLLRPFQIDDLDLIEKIYGDEEILRYTPFDIMPREQATDHLKNIWTMRITFHVGKFMVPVVLRETHQKDRSAKNNRHLG